jgi:type IX secretion system substrate protein/PKD domain-containing protein
MKTRILYLALFFFLCLKTGYSQINDITWQQCYGTSDNDYARSIEKFGKGFLLSVSISKDEPGITNFHGLSDAWVIHADSIGNIIWEKCYGGSNADSPKKLIAIDETSFYMLCFSNSLDGDVQNGRPYDFWIVKIDALGNILWEKSYGNRSCDPRDAILMPDGGLLMMGRIMYAGGDVSTWYGRNDIWMCKVNATGEIEWEKTLGNQGQDNAVKIKLTSDNTVLMIGGYHENGGMIDCDHMGTTEWTDVWIVELDLRGNIIRQLCYGGAYADLGMDIIEVDKAYVFAASSTSYDLTKINHSTTGDKENSNNFWIVKIDFDGNILWQNLLGGSGYDFPNYLTHTNDKGYIVMGNTTSHDGDVSNNHSNPGDMDIWVIKLDSLGNLEWEHCFGGLATERFFSQHEVIKKSDYNYILAAQSNYISGDVGCDLTPNPYDLTKDAWVFEIKDCALYQPQMPTQATGPDTLCYTLDSASVYTIGAALGAWGYTWQLEPEEAGTLTVDTLKAYVKWNQVYEGQANISVQSYNDCGESEWSPIKSTWVYNCVGLEEFNHSGLALKVYPNPAKDKVVFELNNFTPTSKADILIRDITGRIIAQIVIQQKRTSWSCEGLEAGVYFYSLQIGNGNISGKLLLQ